MQAVRRWVKEHGISFEDNELFGDKDKPSLPRPAMGELMALIRPLQRVRSSAESFEWKTAVGRFQEGVKALCIQYGLSSDVELNVMRYFQDNWFCDRWRSK